MATRLHQPECPEGTFFYNPANTMKLAHICIVARDADKLAAFYKDVFRCEYHRAPRIVSDEKVSRGNGLPNAEIYSIWLKFPNHERPFLEIGKFRIVVAHF